MKYLSITLTKYEQNLYEENYKNQMNKIKELNRERAIPYPWIGKLSISFLLVLKIQCNPDQNKNSKVFWISAN